MLRVRVEFDISPTLSALAILPPPSQPLPEPPQPARQSLARVEPPREPVRGSPEQRSPRGARDPVQVWLWHEEDSWHVMTHTDGGSSWFEFRTKQEALNKVFEIGEYREVHLDIGAA
jgi:hypothetical protein